LKVGCKKGAGFWENGGDNFYKSLLENALGDFSGVLDLHWVVKTLKTAELKAFLVNTNQQIPHLVRNPGAHSPAI